MKETMFLKTFLYKNGRNKCVIVRDVRYLFYCEGCEIFVFL